MGDQYPKRENLDKPSPRNGNWILGMLVIGGVAGLMAILVLL